jgi:hypothetical protein
VETTAHAMRVVILERNKLVGRKLARLFLATGASAVAVDEPAALGAAVGGADVVCADAFDGDALLEQLRARPHLRGVLWTAEPLRRSLRYLVESRAIDDVLARRDFESPPPAWEVVMVARRLAGAAAPALGAYLDWGFSALDLDVQETADRDAAAGQIQDFIAQLGAPRRIAEMFAELGHELIMNAMYDAPVDAFGRVKYAADRKADIALADHERPAVRLATDGTRLALQVSDPFGRLERRHVVDGLARGLAGGELDRTHGGAGLGMLVCHNASTALWFDVVPGQRTEVTALLELDVNLRELRTSARSLHFWRA